MLINRPSSRVVIRPLVDTSFFHIRSTFDKMMHVSACGFSNGSCFCNKVSLFRPIIVLRTSSGLGDESMPTLPLLENPDSLLLQFELLDFVDSLVVWVSGNFL